MIYTEGIGYNINDDSIANAESAIGQWQAGAAILKGETCIVDTSVSTGKKCVKLTASGTAHDEHLIVGAFSSASGVAMGGKGSEGTAVTGLSGRDAASGDYIVLSKGPVKVRVDGTADVAAKAALKAFTTAGVLCHDSVWPAGSVTPAGPTINFALYPLWPAFALEAYTTDAIAAKMVFLRGL